MDRLADQGDDTMRPPDAWRGVPREPCAPCDWAWALVFALVATVVAFVAIGLALLGALA